jgi:hypothetical protein
MVKREAVMFATILIALGVGIGAGLLPENPGAQAALAGIGILVGWGLVKVLSRDGDIWKFRAPYP